MEPVTAGSGANAGPLGEGEPGEWAGTASNVGFLALAAFMLLEGAVLQLMLREHPPAGLLLIVVHGFLVIALELQSRIEVRVDRRALTIRYGRLGWLRQRFPIERIVAARAIRLDPLDDYGGWGYRGNLKWRGRAAVVVRAGSALSLDLRDGKHLAITIDGADTAARHIGALISRRAPLPRHPSCPSRSPER